MENIDFNPEDVKILGYRLGLEQINTPLEFDSDMISYHGFHADMELFIDPDDDILRVEQRLEVITESDENNPEEAQAVFQLIYYIRVQEIEKYTVSLEDERIVLHTSLGNFISTITYSTSRGILLTRVLGTGFKDFILPVIDTDSLLSGTLNENI